MQVICYSGPGVNMLGVAPRYIPPKAGVGVGTDSVTIVPAGMPDISPPLLMLMGIC